MTDVRKVTHIIIDETTTGFIPKFIEACALLRVQCIYNRDAPVAEIPEGSRVLYVGLGKNAVAALPLLCGSESTYMHALYLPNLVENELSSYTYPDHIGDVINIIVSSPAIRAYLYMIGARLRIPEGDVPFLHWPVGAGPHATDATWLDRHASVIRNIVLSDAMSSFIDTSIIDTVLLGLDKHG